MHHALLLSHNGSTALRKVALFLYVCDFIVLGTPLYYIAYVF
jgi:hypothetical protein